MGVQRITDTKFRFGLWAFSPFCCRESARGNIKITVTSGIGKQVLVRIIKRFGESGFH